jgi:hypothetical protein
MLRSDHTRAVKFLSHAKRQIGLGQMSRGYLDMDAAGFAASGYAFADNAKVGTAMGMMITRSTALADNHIDYIDRAGTTLHTTTLIAAAGAFDAATYRYTETTHGAGFTAGDLINITGSTEAENNGTFLAGVTDANYVELTALAGESVAVVDEGAVATSIFI